MARITVTGNATAAGKWIGWSKQRLDDLKRYIKQTGLPRGTYIKRFADAIINISTGYGLDIIKIEGLGGYSTIIRCIVGSTTRDVANDRQHLRYFLVGDDDTLRPIDEGMLHGILKVCLGALKGGSFNHV